MLKAYHHYFLHNNEVKSAKDFCNDFMNEGISIYEVVRIINSKALFFEEHFERLENSAKLINMNLWLSKDEVLHQMNHLREINEVTNGNIEFIFHLSENKQASFYCLFIEDRYPSSEMYKNGVPSELYYAERENPNVKVINLDLRSKTVEQIKKNELFEVVLVDKNGFITEGSRSNIFFIKGDKVYTTPVTEVLPGITRMKTIELCKQLGFPIIEEPIKAQEIEQFEAAFFTGTSPGILPISKIGDVNYNPKLSLLKNLVSFFDNIITTHLK